MRKHLHPVQKKLVALLKQNIEDPLTIREIQQELELSSPSVAYHHIQQLENKGYLRRNPSNPKDYQLLADSPDKKIAYINLYGMAHCGHTGSILDGNPIDKIPIATKLLGFPSDEAFMVKAKGDSMTPDINPGDLVIARRSCIANSGNMVVCVNNGETLIKEYEKSGKDIILISRNTKYKPFLATQDFKIEGIVKGKLSHF